LREVGLSSGSIREAVLLEGVLKGMNLEVPCTVRAVKVSLPNLEILDYVRADIAQAPSELPFGEYDVSFEGRTMKVKKTAGGWISGQV
jgi:hypothetical protein